NMSEHWIHTWTAMPILVEPEPDKLPSKNFIRDSFVFANTTLRQTIKMTLGTEKYFRLRFSNAFGTENLKIDHATVALSKNQACGVPNVEPHTMRTVTFDGSGTTTIVGGALAVSDPIDFDGPLPANIILSISLFFKEGQDVRTGITSHPGSRTTSFCVLGDFSLEPEWTEPSLEEIEHWYYISGVEIQSSSETGTIAIIGDSITDGRESTANQNDRWPDRLFSRLQSNPATASLSIISQAAGGNRVLTDGIGPNLLSRLDRDILSLSRVQYVVLFEGVNDIGAAEADEETQANIGDRLIAAYKQIATRVHANGIKIFAATITPFGRRIGEVVSDPEAQGVTWYSHPRRECTRLRVNDWIRESSSFDAIVDFDSVLRDPNHASSLASRFDGGDRLHPNAVAFQALADSFGLEIFTH
ncbi:uncharacterized protein N7483_005426, partial [Penicillium malachiteum]|uniref:uncharacterized protein n=1 Tax=Penicillium malachiteum TaxID=1324776 RepID=UPI002546BAE7